MDRFDRDTVLIALIAMTALSGCAPVTPASPTTPTQQVAEKIAQEENAPEPELAQVDVIGEVFDDYWEIALIQGSKIGYGHTVYQREAGDHGGWVVRESHQRFSTPRDGQVSVQLVSIRSVETSDGRLHSFRTLMSQGDSEISSTGKVDGGSLELVLRTLGKETKTSVALPPETKGLFGPSESLETSPMKPGEKREIAWFAPLSNEVTLDQLTAREIETVPLLDGDRRLLKIDSIDSNGTEKTIWADDQGRIWKTTLPQQNLEIYRTLEARARAKGTGTFDLVSSTMVAISQPKMNLHEAKRAVYLARLNSGDPAKVFLASANQSVRLVGEREAEIAIVRISPTEPETINVVSKPPGPEDLAPNNLIQSDDAKVVEIAQSIVPDETDPWKICLAVENNLHTTIREKNFSQAFTTAAEVAANLEGDCTEHAVLTAAVCRARTIPARVAAGLVYYPKGKSFAYHMWNEVWINDRWIPIDSTLGQGGIGAGHIKLFHSNLAGAGAFSSFLNVMNVLGQVELEVREVE